MLKKLLSIFLFAFVFLSFTGVVSAACPDPENVLCAGIDPSQVEGRVIAPNTSIGSLVSFAVSAIIVVAFLLALIFIVIGAVQWITSGGDKAKVADARNHILAAVIGLVVAALSFVIINVVLQALGLGSLTNLTIPTLSEFTGN